MTVAIDPLLLSETILRLLTSKDVSDAIVALVKKAVEVGLLIRDRATREGTFTHQDSLDALNVRYLARFTGINSLKASGAITAAEAEESIRRAVLELDAELKSLPA